MKGMNKIKKMVFVAMFMLAGTTMMSAEEANVTSEIDTTYIKLDEKNNFEENIINFFKQKR